ncbi:hypothetical protein BLOT_013847 [Blomia tropicalis]|nr:hypothetical protein BLOT_013847 [Blomia tropicalis]
MIENHQTTTKIYNVSVNQWIPFCDLDHSDPTQVKLKFSAESEILKLMEWYYQIKFNLIDCKGDWGMNFNGTWTGALGQVYYKVINQSDIAMCGMTNTPERSAIVDFTHVIYENKLTFMLQNADYWYNDWIYARSFSKVTWILLFSTYLMSALTLIISKMDIEETFFRIFKILLSQSIKLTENDSKPVVRFILIILIVCNYFLTSNYNCNFSSLLAFRSKYCPIKGKSDLMKAAKTDSYNILVHINTSYHSMFIYSEPDNILYQAIGKHLNRSKNFFYKSEVAKEVVENDHKNVIISNKLDLQIIRKLSNKTYHIGEESLANDFTAIAVRKGSSLLFKFNIIIRRMHETGFIQYWRRKMEDENNIKRTASYVDDTQFDRLKLKETRSLFAVLLLGFPIASICLIMELLINHSINFTATFPKTPT